MNLFAQVNSVDIRARAARSIASSTAPSARRLLKNRAIETPSSMVIYQLHQWSKIQNPHSICPETNGDIDG